jgi:hypothetical protein
MVLALPGGSSHERPPGGINGIAAASPRTFARRPDADQSATANPALAIRFRYRSGSLGCLSRPPESSVAERIVADVVRSLRHVNSFSVYKG